MLILPSSSPWVREIALYAPTVESEGFLQKEQSTPLVDEMPSRRPEKMYIIFLKHNI